MTKKPCENCFNQFIMNNRMTYDTLFCRWCKNNDHECFIKKPKNPSKRAYKKRSKNFIKKSLKMWKGEE